MDKQRILIVDDDENIAELISLYMMKECFETHIEHDGEGALEATEHFLPDLIILDLMLPGMDGYQVCREVRKKRNTPIIMLSAKGEVFDKVLGLELGADDYLIKPFDSKELVARVKAVLRRHPGNNTDAGSVAAAVAAGSFARENDLLRQLDEKEAEIARLNATLSSTVETTFSNSDIQCVTYPDLIVNLTNYSVEYKGKPVEMPPKELELLYFLASSPNQVFTREQLLNHIWGYEYPGDTRTVDVHIKRLREKLHDNDNWSIGTVWSVGYKFSTR